MKYMKYVLVGIAVTIACIAISCTPDNKDSAQESTQKVTEEYSQSAIEAVPYPLHAMKSGGWLEGGGS